MFALTRTFQALSLRTALAARAAPVAAAVVPLVAAPLRTYVTTDVTPAPAPPKRPGNAYALFTKDMTPRRPQNVSSQEWFQQIPVKWAGLSHSEKAEYTNLALKLRADYDRAQAEYLTKYTPAQRAAYDQQVAYKKLERAKQTTERLVHGPKSKREGPKKPATSWQLFMMEFRESQPDNVKRDMTQVASLASAKWKSMSDADKAPYVKKADQLREQFKIDQAKV